MKENFPQINVDGRRPAFSLVELLIVVAIMAVLALLAAPAASTIVKGSRLTQAGQMVSGQLGMARQAALTKNRPVEVRFYQYSDPNEPGETAGNAASGKFRAIQCFEVTTTSANTTYTALTKMGRLPEGIVMNKSATLSTLIGNAPVTTTGSALNVNIPRANQAYNVCAFQFRPDGSTDLPKSGTDKWFLTLHDKNVEDSVAEVPANFTTIQIDPFNGHIKTFRP
jgi:uncharacterized protein (TIGR02596 family)